MIRNGCKREILFLMQLGSKNVFVEQVHNTSRPHVCRLVLDRKHKSLALLQKNPKSDYAVMDGG